jgi:response regulator NasT
MFTRCTDHWITSAAVKSGVSAYVVDGLSAQRIKPIMDVAITRFSELQILRDELETATTHLHERKFIERAKGILMRRNNLTEDIAYKTLRTMAMERNKRIADIAESIITAEELLSPS